MKNENLKNIFYYIILIIAGSILGAGITINLSTDNGEINYTSDGEVTLELSDEQVPALIENDQGEITEEYVPTVEEIDGGMFEDATTGTSVIEGDYSDLGWSETYDVSSPEAFKNDTIGKCIIANNIYGAQCVSLARVFWWSYADRDVSTCGTGMAKGMLNCYKQNAGDEFEVHWSDEISSIQAGDWLIFSNGTYGHVGMALGPVSNGYVALLGENQGGKSCGVNVGGSATNIINISTKNISGYYRPKAYIESEPEPEPVLDNEYHYTYVSGDYFSKVLVELGLDENNLWGENGTVAKYTKQLIEQEMLDENGNVKIGKEFILVK